MNWNIYEKIKRRILFFEYPPGQYLNEQKLAAEFGVSRTPVREVLLRLEWEKLISIMPRLGIMVTKIDFQEARDVYRSRVYVEGAVGKLAAKGIRDGHLWEMQRLLDACRKIDGSDARNQLIDLDLEFREVLFHSANSPTLKEISNMLHCQTLRIWYLTFDRTNIPTEVAVEAEEIEGTLEVSRKGDPEAAEQFRRQVIVSYVDRIYKYFTDF